MRLVELWEGKAWKKRGFGGETRFFSRGWQGPAFASERWEVTPGFSSSLPQLALGSNSSDQKSVIPDPLLITSKIRLVNYLEAQFAPLC